MKRDDFGDSYRSVRERVALLDLADEGRFRISGAGATAALYRIFSMDLDIVPRGRGVTGLFLDGDAGVIAIATVFRGEDECYVFTEADTADRLHKYLLSRLIDVADAGDVRLDDLAKSHSWLCVLGPLAQAAMAGIAGDDVLGMPYLSFECHPELSMPVFRMGYCGEYEYRMLCPRQQRESLLARVFEQGHEFGIEQADPAILPLVMLEMRSLRSADIPAGADPLAMGMHWMLGFRKQGYPGAARLDAVKRAPAHRTLMLAFDHPEMAFAGDRLQIEGKDVGHCVRVMFSPTLGRDIGLACVAPDVGWVGVRFDVVGAKGSVAAVGVSAPLFVTRTVRAA